MLKALLKLRNKKGFTLIELVVVLVIMVILAAMAVPTMMGYVENAQKATHLAECRAVYVAAQTELTLARAGQYDGKDTDALTANIQKVVDLPGIKISYESNVPASVADNAVKSFVVVFVSGHAGDAVELEKESVKSVAYFYGTDKFVTLTPGDGTNLFDAASSTATGE